jgi:hypothetical protein
MDTVMSRVGMTRYAKVHGHLRFMPHQRPTRALQAPSILAASFGCAEMVHTMASMARTMPVYIAALTVIENLDLKLHCRQECSTNAELLV